MTCTIQTWASNRLPAVVVSALLLAFPLLAAGSAEAASGEGVSPEQMVRRTSEQVISVLGDQSLSSEQKRQRLQEQLDSCADFLVTSKLVLARNWRSLTDEQKSEFTELFRTYLIVTYRRNLDIYSGETVEIVGSREEARGDYTVQTRINRGGGEKDILVDYRLRESEQGEWRIIDVIVEGISLVSNMRSQFQEVISRGGPEKLLQALREKKTEG
ncbi:MAG: phospholipid-binding protein MlaC [Candidatus Binatia bacterium]